MSAIGRITIFLQSGRVFETEKQNGRQIHYEMYYYSIYPEPLSSMRLVYLHFQGGNLSKCNPLCLFKAIKSFAAILLLVNAKITSDD